MKAREIEKCIDLFGTDIYRFCLKLCANKADAEDLYQQIFLKALESSYALDWEQNPKALFFSFAYKLWKSNMRKSARRAAIAPCSNYEEIQEEAYCSGEDIEADFYKKELVKETNRIIESLPEKFRVPLTLFYLFEFPLVQVAALIHKPAGTVKSRLSKGRRLIKKGLEEAGYDG